MNVFDAKISMISKLMSALFLCLAFLEKSARHVATIIQLIGKSIKSIILDSVKNIVFLKL
jgi:hypothetical protein